MEPFSAEEMRIAQAFHEEYERLAETYWYKTPAESAVPWDQVPIRIRSLMCATVAELLEKEVIKVGKAA